MMNENLANEMLVSYYEQLDQDQRRTFVSAMNIFLAQVNINGYKHIDILEKGDPENDTHGTIMLVSRDNVTYRININMNSITATYDVLTQFILHDKCVGYMGVI